jgi:hypothetical protein
MSLQSERVKQLEDKIILKEFAIRTVPRKIKGVITFCEEQGYQKEDAFLADCFEWLRVFSPDLVKFIFHVENEGDSSSEEARIRGAFSLSKGKLGGVPDVICVWNNQLHCAEFKLPGGTLNKNQKEIFPLWTSHGVRIDLIFCFADWKRFIYKVLDIVC